MSFPLPTAIGALASILVLAQPASAQKMALAEKTGGVSKTATSKGKTTSKMAPKAKTGAMLPGGNSDKPINIEAVKLDYYDKEQKLVYTGNVVATQGDSKLKSSVLTIFLAPKKSGEAQPAQSSTGQVQRMLATGPVTLLQKDQVGTGDSGVYDKLLNTVVLTGNVTLSQGPNVTKGDRLVYNLKSGQAVVTGRVKSMFLPDDVKKDDQGDKSGKSEPAPEATSRQ